MAKFQLKVPSKDIETLKKAAHYSGVKLDDEYEEVADNFHLTGSYRSPVDLYEMGQLQNKLAGIEKKPKQQ